MPASAAVSASPTVPHVLDANGLEPHPRFTTYELLLIARDCAQAVAFLHSHNVVHADIKVRHGGLTNCILIRFFWPHVSYDVCTLLSFASFVDATPYRCSR